MFMATSLPIKKKQNNPLQTSIWPRNDMTSGDKQIHTCLFAHEFIIVGEEGPELCRSVGEDFEDIR